MGRSYSRTLSDERRRRYDGKRGPNGRRLCRWCGTEVPRGRRTFCGDDCIHEWRLRSDPGYMRAQVWRRDRGVCASCGIDTTDVIKQIGQIRAQVQRDVRIEHYPIGNDATKRYHRYLAAMEQHFQELLLAAGIDPSFPRSRDTLWDADHIVPVSEGGGECGMENIRTLCWWCHQTETAKMHRRKTRKG